MSARDAKPHCNKRATCDTALAQAVTKVAYDLTTIEGRFRWAKIAHLTGNNTNPSISAGYAKEFRRLDAKRQAVRDIAISILRICRPLPRRQRLEIWRAARAGYRTARIISAQRGGAL